MSNPRPSFRIVAVLLYLLVCAVVVLIDRLSKIWVMGSSHLAWSINPGIAFGIGSGTFEFWLMWLVIQLSVLTLFLVGLGVFWVRLGRVNYGSFGSSVLVPLLGAGMLTGGALGNIWDRLVWHGVVDFIHISVWPGFNLADLAISLGLFLLGFSFIFSKSVWNAKKH